MCGFLTEFAFETATITDVDVFSQLLALSRLRGPDITQTLRKTNYQLGFNRLAILDLTANGNQPKLSPSGRYVVVFNGEIYNFKKLIEIYRLTDLGSTSDTEVIVHLLDLLGIEQTILTLNGMFAINIVDTQTEMLYLSRDFAGIKPLFYGLSDYGIVAASQFNQVFKHPWFKDNLRLFPEAVKDYFGFGYMQSPNTIYQTIFQVDPGTLIEINNSGEIVKKTLTEFSRNITARKESNLEDCLRSAVKRQLVSDVPIASFLSGGIDSPLISAYAKEQKDGLAAFTLEVDDASLDESELAKRYAEHLDIDQHIVKVKPQDLLEHIEAHFVAFSEPFGDYSSIPTYAISKEAKKQHTVMLSGDGGDELFYGYPRMMDVLNKAPWFRLPIWLRKPLVKITNTLGITNTYAPYLKNLNHFIINKHVHLPSHLLDRLIPKTNFSIAVTSLFRFKHASRVQLAHQLRWNEFYAHLQRILIKVDRASMGNSLEVRVPFLDREVIEYSWQLTNELRSNQDLKIELKSALGKLLPEQLINEKKMGFTVPINQWLNNELKSDVQKMILETPIYGKDIINTQVLKSYIEDFYSGKHSNGWGVWHMYAWQKWSQQHT